MTRISVRVGKILSRLAIVLRAGQPGGKDRPGSAHKRIASPLGSDWPFDHTSGVRTLEVHEAIDRPTNSKD
jgi:hypothetical protein